MQVASQCSRCLSARARHRRNLDRTRNVAVTTRECDFRVIGLEDEEIFEESNTIQTKTKTKRIIACVIVTHR